MTSAKDDASKQTPLRSDWVLIPSALMGLFAPSNAARVLAESDFAVETRRNQQLCNSTDEAKERVRREFEEVIPQNLRSLRRVVLLSGLAMATAVGAAFLSRQLRFGVPATGPILALGSIFCFAWATLGRLGWESFKGDSTVERLDRWIFRVLYWIGTYLGSLAVI